MDTRKQCRLVVLFPLPFQGHINPMFQLANILHSQGGFAISIIHTELNFPDTSNYPHFDIHSISDGLSRSRPFTTDDIINVVNLLNTNCVEPFKRCLAQILSESRGRNADVVPCIVTDAIWQFTQAVADEMEIPRIVLRTSSACSFLAFAALPLFLERGYITNDEAKLEDPIPEFPPLKVKDIPAIGAGNQDNTHQLISNVVRTTKKSSCLIFNTFQELESPELARLHDQFRIPVFAIGPFHKRFSAAATSLLTQDRTSITWLDNQSPKSVLYVSFGSVAALEDKSQLLEVAWGLANSRRPFLWVIRVSPGSTSSSEFLLPEDWRDEVGGRGCVVEWAPQQEVLAHGSVGGFWTHSGWNSTVESLCEGVPMMCSPFFGDQTVNARWVGDVWRIGIVLERGFDRGEIAEAVERLMGDAAEGEDMRRRVVSLKDAAEACLEAGRSSYKSLEGLCKFVSELV